MPRSSEPLLPTNNMSKSGVAGDGKKKRVLIVGAGAAGKY
jgi:hypothetical protein